MEKEYLFKYKNSTLFKIPVILFSLFYFILCIIIFKYINDNADKLLYMLLFLLINILWMIQIKKRLDVTDGKFILKDNELSYITLNKIYNITYEEIESIIKEKYIEDTNIISYYSYQYIIYIKNSGSFTFKYYDNSLDIAINALANKINQNINEK